MICWCIFSDNLFFAFSLLVFFSLIFFQVRTLLYKYNYFNLPACARNEEVGFDNCTMRMLLHPSFGPWTPKRENYTRKKYHNPHYYSADDNVCIHMLSSNKGKVKSKKKKKEGRKKKEKQKQKKQK